MASQFPATPSAQAPKKDEKPAATSAPASTSSSTGWMAAEITAEVAVNGGIHAAAAGIQALRADRVADAGEVAAFSAKQAAGSLATETNAQIVPAVADYATVAGDSLVTQVGNYTTVGSIGGDAIDVAASSADATSEAAVTVADSGFFEAAGELLGAAAETTGEVLGSVAEGTVEVIGGIIGGLLS